MWREVTSLGCQVTSLGCQVTSRRSITQKTPGKAARCFLTSSWTCAPRSQRGLWVPLDRPGRARSSSCVHTSARCDIVAPCASRYGPKRQSEPFAEPWVMDVVNEHGLIITSSPQALRTSLPTLETLAALASEHQAEDRTVPRGQPPSTGPTPPTLHTSHSCVHQRCRL